MQFTENKTQVPNKAWGIKPGLFLSAPAATAPHFHFPSALSCSHCSCCFSCCSLPLSSLCSLPGRGSRFTFPQGWEQLSRAFLALLRGKSHCSVSSPVIPLPFQALSPPGSIPLCPAEELLPREALTCLGLGPGVSRGRR